MSTTQGVFRGNNFNNGLAVTGGETVDTVLVGSPVAPLAGGVVAVVTSITAARANTSNANGPVIQTFRNRGTDVSQHGAVQTGDELGRWDFIGDDGATAPFISSRVSAVVNGTVATNQIPADLVFKTSATNAAGLTEALRIGSTQVCTFANGFVTTAGIVNLGGFSRVTGSNFTTTGQVLTNITGLTFATVANATYHFRVLMTTTSSSVAGNQYGIQHSGAGASVEAQAGGVLLAGGAQNVRINALNTATVAFDTAAADGGMVIEGILVVGANAGNLTPQILKVTSGTATVYINSFMEVKRIA